jgi:hypothetical protein
MIMHGHTPQARPTVSSEASTPFDVLWGKPLFRAPNLPTPVTEPAVVPFIAQRVTGKRRTQNPARRSD